MRAKVSGEIKVTGEKGELIAIGFFNRHVQADCIKTLSQICDASAIVMNELVQQPENLARTIQLLMQHENKDDIQNKEKMEGGPRGPEACLCRMAPRRGGENGRLRPARRSRPLAPKH